jgi:hypothetical protein
MECQELKGQCCLAELRKSTPSRITRCGPPLQFISQTASVMEEISHVFCMLICTHSGRHAALVGDVVLREGSTYPSSLPTMSL